MDAQTFMDKIDEIVANAPNDYPCDRCIYFAGDYHPAFCLNPYAKVDPVLNDIVSRVTIDGGKCPGLVEGEPAWLRIFLSSEEPLSIEEDYRRAQEIEKEFEKGARLELFKTR